MYGVTSADGTGTFYVADTDGNRIRKITSGAVVTTFAGSGTSGTVNATGTAAQFADPRGIKIDNSGNIIVGDRVGNRIRKITPSAVVTTIAGDGSASFADGLGTAAKLYAPGGVSYDTNGNIYVTDAGNMRIRKISFTGEVTTIAGTGEVGYADGNGIDAVFSLPYGITPPDTSGNFYISDYNNGVIRKLTPVFD